MFAFIQLIQKGIDSWLFDLNIHTVPNMYQIHAQYNAHIYIVTLEEKRE